MKRIIQVMIAATVLAGLCVGCGKSKEPEPKPLEQAKKENWEPETVALPEGHSKDDGHDHSSHGNDGHDHSGHNH